MKASVSKWGHSLAIRVPKAFAEQLRLAEGSAIDLRIEGESLVVCKPAPTLDELLDQVTDENKHPETSFGSPVGKEVWW